MSPQITPPWPISINSHPFLSLHPFCSCSPFHSTMGNCCSGGTNESDNKGETNQQNDNEGGTANAPPQSKPNHPPTKPSKPAPIGPVLGRPMEDVRSTYSMGKELGRGQFGVTHLCTHKSTGKQYACKTIAKRKLVNKEDIEDVKREVQIMHHLSGQPNVVELVSVFEDKQSVHLVMELCAGGELFDRIIAKGHYTERAAASLLRTIVQIVHTCHSMGVIHRDLKPENFLLSSKDENAPLKATDFGLSVFYKQGQSSSSSSFNVAFLSAFNFWDLPNNCFWDLWDYINISVTFICNIKNPDKTMIMIWL